MSVGIPTFNRVAMLTRAVESVLAQDYCALEVVISDNASTDGTQAWCESVARRDSRVRYFRQPVNHGAAANFAEVFRRSRGSLYMVLGDDDWLEPTYISRCSKMLLEQPDLVVVCGTPRMFRGEVFLYQGRKMNLLQTSATQRVATYLWQVAENVPFHGVMRREVLSGLRSLPNVLGSDWLFGAWLAFLGKIQTLDNTAINKSMAGTRGDWTKIVRGTHLPEFCARIPYLLIMGSVFQDVAWGSPVYAPAGRVGRVRIACLATAVLLAKFSLWSVAVVAKGFWYRLTSRPFPFGTG